jgi:NADH-quinone oxidoreductase subunit J
MFDVIAFYFFAALAVMSAILVVTARNAVHSAIFLVTALLATAGIFLQLHAEFLFIVQVILYVGGIMVLFVFVIMLVNLDVAARQTQFNRMWPMALLLVLVVSGQIYALVHYANKGIPDLVFQLAVQPLTRLEPNSEKIGESLFTDYMLPFEIASIMLLVAMIGAVVMAKRKV